LAEADPFHAGISRLTIPASAPFDALVWYPTNTEDTSWDTNAIPGTHFILADMCPPGLQAAAPEVCTDPPGVDRTAVHAAVEAQVVRVLKDNL
jgi:hypothetical protein